MKNYTDWDLKYATYSRKLKPYLEKNLADHDIVEEFATNLAYEGDDKFLVDDEARLNAILNEELG